jgi:hypothetical protein
MPWASICSENGKREAEKPSVIRIIARLICRIYPPSLIEKAVPVINDWEPQLKIQLSRAKCSHRETFINALKTPDGKTNNHSLITRRWHSSILDVLSLGGTECDTYCYLVVTKVKETLSVSELAGQ